MKINYNITELNPLFKAAKWAISFRGLSTIVIVSFSFCFFGLARMAYSAAEPSRLVDLNQKIYDESEESLEEEIRELIKLEAKLVSLEKEIADKKIKVEKSREKRGLARCALAFAKQNAGEKLKEESSTNCFILAS